ncbi:MAG: DUF2232 domain-containing protein [Firmicutes bacterium]|nr:DUF2232 domain-containing protein [Bacillota bacterium]
MYFLMIFAFIFIVPIIVIVWNLKKNVSPYQTLFESIVLTSMVVIAILFSAFIDSGVSLGDQLMGIIKEAAGFLAGTEEFVKAAGIGNMTYDERVSLIVSAYGMMNSMLPSTVLISGTLVSYFLYMIISKMYKSVGGKPAELVPLKFFRWPPNTMTGFLAMFLLSFVIGLLPAFEGMQIYMNISVIFEFVIAVQGLGFVFLIFDMKKIPKAFAVVVGIIGMATSFGRMILFAVGAFDYMINMRGRMARR